VLACNPGSSNTLSVRASMVILIVANCVKYNDKWRRVDMLPPSSGLMQN
jgi:hypothetical protein